MSPQSLDPELVLGATRNAAFGEAQLDLAKAQANDANANAADAQGQAQLRQLQIRQAMQTQAAINAAYQNAITNPATQTPSAATSTPAAVQGSTLPGGLINRTGQNVDGVPSLGATPSPQSYTLGSIGSPAAAGPAAQPNAAQPAPAPVFDTSQAAITARMRDQLVRVLPPAAMTQWETSVKGSLDNQEAAVKLHDATVASRDNDIATADYKTAGGDPDQTVALMKQHGATPTGIAKFQNAMTEVAQHAATLKGAEIDNGIKQSEGLAAALSAYAKQPRQDQLDNWQQFGQQMITSGKWDPKTDGDIPAVAPSSDQMNEWALHHLTWAHQLDAEKEKREALTASNAEADRKATQATAQRRLDQEAIPKTPAELALMASDPTKTQPQRDAANAALKRLDSYQQAGRPVNNNTTVNLTPEAKAMYADALREGKPLPSFGRNGSGAIGEISNLAASKGPVNMAQTAANFKADSGSLAATTKSLDNLSAFETSAIANLKLFTDAAAKLPDTGVPWLNMPVRVLDEKLVGSTNMAAVNAARNIGLREIARITNDPKMSGQLTDTARKEVMDFSPKDATIPQIMAVAKLVQQDVANVHAGLAGQKAAIQQRLGGGAAPAAAPAPAVPRVTTQAQFDALPRGATYTEPDGNTYRKP